MGLQSINNLDESLWPGLLEESICEQIFEAARKAFFANAYADQAGGVGEPLRFEKMVGEKINVPCVEFGCCSLENSYFDFIEDCEPTPQMLVRGCVQWVN